MYACSFKVSLVSKGKAESSVEAGRGHSLNGELWVKRWGLDQSDQVLSSVNRGLEAVIANSLSIAAVALRENVEGSCLSNHHEAVGWQKLEVNDHQGVLHHQLWDPGSAQRLLEESNLGELTWSEIDRLQAPKVGRCVPEHPHVRIRYSIRNLWGAWRYVPGHPR